MSVVAPAGRSWRSYAAVVLGALGLLVGLYIAVLHLTRDPLADVHAYYDAGSRLNAGLPLYDQPATTNDAAFYRYPPLLAIAFRPLALLPFHVAAVIWEIAVVASFLATLWMLGVRKRSTWLVVGLLAAPIAWSVVIGQAHVLVTFLLTLGTPFGAALAGHLKIFPALAAVYWLGRRDWRRLGEFVTWVLGLLLVSFVLEPRGTIDFLSFPDLEQVGAVRNLSPYAVSPVLWGAVVVALGVAALVLSRTRFGWLMAVALTVFVAPRLLMYQFMALLAGARRSQDHPD